MESLLQDVRYAARALRRAPGFTIAAVLTLALGIGANTTIFSLANALILRPLPVRDPGHLVRAFAARDNANQYSSWSFEEFAALRKDARSSVELATYSVRPMNLASGGQGVRIATEVVSSNYFTVLGLRAALGRLFVERDEIAAGTGDVVLGHRFWTQQFAGDSNVVGMTVTINGTPLTVVGVAPKDFRGTFAFVSPDMWIELGAAPALLRQPDLLRGRGSAWMNGIGRLAPGSTSSQATATLTVLRRRLAEAAGDTTRGFTATLESATHSFGQRQTAVTAFMGVLLGIVGIVLLVACVNLAGLLLANAMRRTREISLRLALGASRGRIVRQMLAESGLLGLLGGSAGLLVAFWGTGVLSSIKPPAELPITLNLSPDWRVLTFALIVSLLAGVGFGLVPALGSTRSDVIAGLRGGVSNTRRSSRLRSTFLATQIAISLVLVIGAGLLMRGLSHAAAVNPGFDPAHTWVASIDLRGQGYDSARANAFVSTFFERVAATPGVEAVAGAEVVPLSLSRQSINLLIGAEQARNTLDYNVTTPGYFGTMRIPVRRGRDFASTDRAGAERVAIVNETMAKRYWPSGDALGQRVRFGPADSTGAGIVGVVADAKYNTLGEVPQPFIYFPFAQQQGSTITVHVRARDAAVSMAAARRIATELAPSMPGLTATPLTQALGTALLPQRFAAALSAAFGLLGVLLAAIGIAGVTGFAVTQRTREIGVRVALGAHVQSVVRLVLVHGLRAAFVGIVAGIAGAAALSRVLRSLLFDVSPTDPLTFAATATLFAVVALVAGYIPARRAARIDPMVALRSE
jgi:predicted permease